jgi:hypothetical protein
MQLTSVDECVVDIFMNYVLPASLPSSRVARLVHLSFRSKLRVRSLRMRNGRTVTETAGPGHNWNMKT